LTDVVDTVCGADSVRPESAGERAQETELPEAPFGLVAEVVAVLGQCFSVPLPPEDLRCTAPTELVELINTQVTSGV
jgi:hypothetical protein